MATALHEASVAEAAALLGHELPTVSRRPVPGKLDAVVERIK